MIDPSEKEDFLKGITKMGYNADDFDIITGERLKTTTKGIYPLNETVAVHRKSTDILVEYRSGHGEAWGAQAELDVKKGLFGKP